MAAVESELGEFNDEMALGVGCHTLAELESKFRMACETAKQPKSACAEAGMAERLRLYGYYKRATIGPASGAPPQGVDFKSRSKHEAWQEASGNSRSESMILYVHLVNAIEDERVRSRVLEARKKRTARRTSVNWDPELGQSPRAGGAAGGDQGVALPGGEPMLREGLTLMPFPQHGDPSMRSPAPFPHFFFVWVDPEKPAAARDEAWPLPDTYRRNVEHWSERYQVEAVDSDGEANCPGLLGVYEQLEREGNWIKMVDIARLALVWLKGGTYLDTDMEVGPMTFSTDELSDGACWLVRDPEGVIQNHFIRAPPRHLFVRHLLHVMLANALAELHVVQATGPCAYAAAFLNAFGEEAEQAEPAWEGGVDFHTRQAAAGGVDPFSREQVQALADRLRERLITCGYEDPRSEGFRSWFALEPHAAVRLYPPSAFYTHHWREDSSAAEGRSRARFLQLPAPQAPPPSPRGGIRHDCAVARRPRRA